MSNRFWSRMLERQAPTGKRGTHHFEKRRKCRGSTLVEFAFLIPVLFALVFGIIDFGRMLYSYHFVSNAAREATRWASVRGRDCTGLSGCPPGAAATDVSSYVTSIAPMGIDTSPSKLNVTTNWVMPPNNLPICTTYPTNPGCAVQVQVSYQFKFILPFLPTSGYRMTSTSEMIISQ
jgi:Flp pilus assembly protein TadG